MGRGADVALRGRGVWVCNGVFPTHLSTPHLLLHLLDSSTAPGSFSYPPPPLPGALAVPTCTLTCGGRARLVLPGAREPGSPLGHRTGKFREPVPLRAAGWMQELLPTWVPGRSRERCVTPPQLLSSLSSLAYQKPQGGGYFLIASALFTLRVSGSCPASL